MITLASIFIGISTVLVLAATALFVFLKKSHTYWDKKKIPNTGSRTHTFLGDIRFDMVLTESFAYIYKFMKEERFFGFYLAHKPAIMINDPDLIKKVLITDFSHFRDHGLYVNVKDDPLSNHLFAVDGQEWKNLRTKISPAFSSGKMKNMFPIIDSISKNMYKVLDTYAESGEVVDVRDVIGRYGTDVIGNIAFGIDTNTLDNPDSIFRKMGKKVFAPSLSKQLKLSVLFFLPDIAKIFGIVQFESDVTQFFLKLVRDNIEYREKNNVTRNDILQLLIQLMKKGHIDDVDNKDAEGTPFTFEDAAAQAFVFFVGGFETTSGAMQLTLYHLAKDQAIQDKLREEIRRELKKTDGKMTYEAVFNMKYGGMILDESQRMYPQGGAVFRKCNKDYPIDGSDFVIEKETHVYISIMGLHHDPRYFPNPSVFDPERFTDEEKSKRPSHSYLPFGDGPRFCIGQRFAMMQMRAVLFSLISRYRFECTPKTPQKIVFDPQSVILSPKEPLYLKVTKLQD